MVRYAVVETNVDAVLADALREKAGTQIGLSNGFRFASPKLPGPIQEADIWDWYPISTRLKVGKVTGKQLRDFWERELEHVFASDPAKLFGGWVPRPSGLTLKFKAKATQGERVQELMVAGKPVEDETIYTVVACEREGGPLSTLCQSPTLRNVEF